MSLTYNRTKGLLKNLKGCYMYIYQYNRLTYTYNTIYQCHLILRRHCMYPWQTRIYGGYNQVFDSFLFIFKLYLGGGLLMENGMDVCYSFFCGGGGGVDYFGGKLFLYTWQYQYRKSSICWTIMFHPCWTNENIFILFYLTWSICSFERKAYNRFVIQMNTVAFLFRRKRLMSP